MTVHCVELMCSTDVDLQKVQNKINDLKSKYGEALPSQNFELRQVNMTPTQTQSLNVLKANFRVLLGNNSDKITEKDDLLEQIQKEMDKSASWWQTRWHECTHDNTTKTVERTVDLGGGNTETYIEEVKGCAWSDGNKSNSSTIPDEVEFTWQ